MTDEQYRQKLVHVSRPLVRGKLTFEPLVPPDGPVTDGPLIRVGRPLKRVKLTFEPVPIQIGLRLTPGPDSNNTAVAEAIEKVFPTGELSTPAAATVAQFLHELEGLGYRFELMVEPPVSG